MLTFIGYVIAAWIGVIVGITLLAVVQGHHLRQGSGRCCGHYEWDPASWQFVPVPADEEERCP